jgi:uncharacterized protein YodC (DUF2158 family)
MSEQDFQKEIDDSYRKYKAKQELIGKTVRLKSGELVMTAAALADDGGILCVWADVGCVCQQSIPMAALEIVTFNSRDGWQAQDGVAARGLAS